MKLFAAWTKGMWNSHSVHLTSVHVRPAEYWFVTRMHYSKMCTAVAVSVGGLPQCMLGYHPPDQAHPPEQTPPPGAYTPQSRHPPGSRHPQEQTHACGQTHACENITFATSLRTVKIIQFFTISNSVRSDKSRSGVVLSAFIGVNYLIQCTYCSEGE